MVGISSDQGRHVGWGIGALALPKKSKKIKIKLFRMFYIYF